MAQAQRELIELVVYDFDQTISSDHIYHKLDAMAKSRTAKGQVDELKNMSLNELYATFGGKDRVSRLDLHFKRVRSSADVAILSFGYVNVIKKSLEILKLSEHFENMSIIGCDSAELKKVHGNKAQCIQGMKKQRNLKSHQVLFVDDDSSNIRKAKTMNACETIDIKPRNGMTGNHMENIEKRIGVFEIEKKEQNKKLGNNESDISNSASSVENSEKNSNSNNNNNSNNSSNNDGVLSNGKYNENNSNHNNTNESTNNNNSNDDQDNDNSNTNNSNTDDSKEPTTNRQSSLKQFKIGDDNNQKFEMLLKGNEESEGTPVVHVPHASDSETNDNGDNIVLTTPVFTQQQE